MAYLTFEEYQALGSIADDLTEDKFNKSEAAAESLFDIATKSFYRMNDLESDAKWRKDLFKHALAQQVNFSNYTGLTTPYEVSQSSVQRVSIGRTTVEGGDAAKSTVGRLGIYGVAYTLLAQTGLMYRGVSSCY
ncbi:hypothetical protein FC65_GL000862 [Ligilactobacillus acidipiscis DSM 15836]|uniref:Protein gp8 n=1 Tax=Ligilactobacillus acidipiscis DSM 15836 TaxID=1423716 RepID=A0ABR5PND5_9LACO|nr:hypothetical protein [Ligilactobacillus acidipiscis]KRM31952.1 hypothetical protein FC65_GL000862 [Ligilactobacillus acidipiscis DSM 15836]GAW63071.1 hypothetical protein Lacidipiscis_00253 [Ligilactobacillus acidipiscis]GEN19665.1 hypothetical protein LAC02_29460 [Ligilactobacillus acidipiscis]